MQVIPAIDILGGKVVRLLKGSFDNKQEYGDDPVSIAKLWQREGAKFLHIVDLDGAKEGEPKNAKIIEEIFRNISIPAEVGGGIRTKEHIEMYIKFGADRVVVGTAALHDLCFLEQKEIKDKINKIAISLDAKMVNNGSLPMMMAGTAGWRDEVPIFDYRGLIEKIFSSGIKYLNYTDRSKDGTLSGLLDIDLKNLGSFLKAIIENIEVTYAGGIASLKDIQNLKNLGSDKLKGVVIGKALYEKRFSFKEALNVVNVS